MIVREFQLEIKVERIRDTGQNMSLCYARCSSWTGLDREGEPDMSEA
jgi:hypothetical protein